MFKRKLFKHAFSKRALPVILSVAMIFQSMPATAMAAENAVAVEGSVEDTTDEQTATEAAEPASEQGDSEASNESVSSEVEVSEETSSETVSEESVSTEETTDTESATEENNLETDTSVQETSTPESSSNEETTTAESTESEQTTQKSTVEETEEMQEAANEAEAGLVTELKIELGEAGIELLNNGFKKVVDEKDPDQLKYAAPYGTDFSWIKELVKDNTTIRVDEEDLTDNLREYLQLKWLQIEESGEIVIPGLPDKADKTYCLEVSNEAVKDLCQAAEPQRIFFEITKAEITLNVDNVVKAKPGTKIADFIKDLEVGYTLSTTESSAVDKAVVKSFAANVYEVDSKTGKRGETPVTEGVFDKKKNYTVEISVVLNDETAQNYTVVQQDYYVITVRELQETKVLVERTEPGKEIIRTYDAADIKLESVEELKNVKVQLVAVDDKTETPIDEQEKNIEPAWYTREFLSSNITSSEPDKETQIDVEVENGTYRYTRLPEGKNPKDAGEYYIIYVYSGDGEDAYYQASNSAEDAILMTIEAAPVIVIPGELTLAEGMTPDEAKEALLQLTYNIYLEGTTTPVYTPKHDDFFGVWYDSTDKSEKIQYYQPTFEIWTRQEKKNLSSDTDKWEDWERLSGNIILKTEDGRAVEYQVRFTGEKCVYDANGKAQGSASAADTTTNAAEKNYLVKTDSASLEKNVGSVTVTTPKETSIKTEAIVSAFKDKIAGTGTLDDPLSKIYNEKPLYEKRDEYKQAVVEGATSSVASTDDRLTYTWTRISLSKYDEYKKLTTEEKENLNINDFLKWSPVLSDDVDDTIYAPVRAGVYKLNISYKDDSHNDLASSADLYFKIDQQEVMIVSKELKASYGESISDFEERYTNRASYDDYVAYIIPDNDTSKLPENIEEREKLSYSFSGQWHVQRPKKNDDGTDSTEYITPDETAFIDASYAYVAFMTYDGIYKYNNDNYNYTSIDRKNSTEEETKYHYEAAAIQFIGEKEIVFEIDANLMPKDKIYDGTPIAEKMPEGLVKIKAKADNADLTEDLLNPEGTIDNDKVTVAWKWDNDSDEVARTTAEAVYGGKYTLYAHFSGNKDYAAYEESEWVELTDENGNPYTFEIKPLEIDITPILRTDITAGDEVWKLIWEDQSNDPYYKIEYAPTLESGKIPEQDEKLFQYYTNNNNGYRQGFPLFSEDGSVENDLGDFSKTVTDNTTGTPVLLDNYLKYGNTYTVRYGVDEYGLGFPWNVSYEVHYKPATITVEKHSHATVSDTYSYSEYDASVISSLEENTHTITPRAMVKFADKAITVADGKKAPADRNYIAFRINAPKEFDSDWDNGKKIVYKTNIENAGGYLLRDWDSSKSIDVLFPVVKATDGTIADITFAITWEKDFTETFTLNIPADRLEADLKNAVEPKSLSFNGVTTKMAVGSVQSLDVKITKAQLGDIIKINYRLADGTTKNDNISIDPETGVVTALATTDGKPVTVQIEAYPVHRGSDGKLVPIETKKIAKTKITVTEVTAPAIKKLTFSDDKVDVTLGAVADGYRREIYVVKAESAAAAKKMKMVDFEPLIEKMSNGQWNGIFEIKPEYVYATAPSAPISLDGLEPDTAYAVYVRNVSAVRMLSDGSKVTLSKNGTVKAFTTTKSQVKGLDLDFNPEDTANKGKLIYDSEYDWKTTLSAKNLQLSVKGMFDETYGHEAADKSDEIWFKLPLNTKEEQQKAYVNPKLTYAICDEDYYNINSAFLKTSQSKYATINNKGKVTLKGVGLDGEKVVYIYVKADNGEWDVCSLHIVTDTPNTITGKKAKIKVGEEILLRDYLEYKLDKAKVPGFYSSGIEILNWTDAEAAGFSIKRTGDNQYNIKCEAVKPEGKNFKLQIQDHGISGETTTAEVTLTSAPLDPVKGLKVGYVDDKNITLNFTYAGHPESYDIEVRDARQNLILKTLVDAKSYASYTGYDIKGEKAAQQKEKVRQQWIQTNVSTDDDSTDNPFIYYTKTKTYAYTIADPKLIRLSAYNITVTPVYKDQIAKIAKTKAKTTNIPASTNNMDAVDYEWTSGGMLFKAQYGDWDEIPTYFTAGNTYTLRASFNDDAQTRVTDTLTWKSSNTKVATIKANPGTYTATFKPLKSGTTIITVTSKITKKIIGRYLVEVKSVGSAGAIYGGDYEQTWSDSFYRDILAKYDPLYHGKLEVLTETQPLSVNGNESVWVSFTAPTFGEYTFSAYSSWTAYSDRNLAVKGDTTTRNESYFLEAGQTIYFRFANGVYNFTVEGTEFAKLNAESNNSKESALEVTAEEWVSFTAPEDNYYRFMGARIGEVRKNNERVSYNGNGIGLKAGDTLLIKINSGSALWVSKSDAATKLTKEKPVTVNLTKDNNVSYVYFAAPVTAKYTFTTKNADAEYIKADGTLLDSIFDSNTSGNVCELKLQKDETIAIKLTATDDKFTETSTENRAVTEISASVSVTVNEKPLAIGGTQTIGQGTTELVSVVLPKDTETAKYVFKVADGSIRTVYNDALNAINDVYDNTLTLTVKKSSQDEPEPGDTIYLEVTADSSDTDTATAVISANAVQNITLSANTEDTPALTDGFEKWYTFTAQTDGYYEISAEVSPNANNGATHSVSVSKYDKLFGNYRDSITSGDFVQLKMGEPIVFSIKADSIGNNADGTPITSTASVVVKSVKITPITIGTIGTKVDIPAKGEPAYYSLTAPETGNYNLTWVVSAADTAELRFSETFVGNKNNTMNNEWNVSSSIKELEAGRTYYFQVKPTSDAAVSGNIIVTIAPKTETLENNTPKSFSLKKGETKTYRFTAPSKEILGYAVKVDTLEKDGKKPEVTVSVNDDYQTTGSTLYIEGQIINERYVSSDLSISTEADTAAGSITITPITAVAWGDDAVKATNLKPVYYQYPVEKAGRYQFTGKAADANAELINLSGMVVAKDGKTIRARWTSWTNLTTTYLREGDVVYAKASTNATTEQGAVIQKPVIIEKALTLDDKDSAAITLPEGQTQDYYVFTAPVEAYYTFAGIGCATKMYTPKVNKDKTEDDTFSSNTLLNAGDQVLVTVSESGTLTVTRNEVQVLSIGADKKANDIQLEPDKARNFSFKVYEKGIYSVKVEGTDSSLNIVKLDETGSEIATSISNYLVIEYSEPGTAAFSISNSTATAATVSITVERLNNLDLKLGTEGNSITVPKNEIRLATFTVEESGRYRFASDNDKVQISATGGYNIPVDNSDVVLNKGTKRTFIFTGDKDAEQTVKFTVNIVTPKPVTEPTLEVPADTSEWFVYESKKAAWYTFELKEGEITQSFDLYNSMVDNSPMNDTKKIWLDEGDTIILKVSNESEAVKNYTFTAVTEEAVDSEKLTFSRPYETQTIEFEIPETGIYKVTGFTKDKDSYFYVYIYKNNSYEKYFPVSTKVSHELILNQGDTIKVKVSAQNTNSKTISIILDMTVIDELSLGSNTIDLDNSEKIVQFTAPEDGFYIFTASDSNLSYYADNLFGSYVTCNSSGNQQFFIMKDKTVFLKANGSSDTSTITVENGDPIPNITTLWAGDSVEVAVEEGESKWFTFTAPSDGEYRFYSSDNNGDPKASLYAGLGNHDSSNSYNGNTYYCDILDDDSDDSNFVITYNLEEGQKIYLEAYGYSKARAQYMVNVRY